jgi:hypothetical protein
MIDRHGEELAHATVRVHAEHSYVLAVVVMPAAARRALPTVQVGLDRAAVPDRYPSVVTRRFHDFRSQFMPHHARISEEGLAAMEGVEISAADTHAMNP